MTLKIVMLCCTNIMCHLISCVQYKDVEKCLFPNHECNLTFYFVIQLFIELVS